MKMKQEGETRWNHLTRRKSFRLAAPCVCQTVFGALTELHNPPAAAPLFDRVLLFVCFLFQKYRHHDEDSSPQDQSSPQLTEEAGGAELVQVAEKNLSQIENVHGYVTHAHISPMKVGDRFGFILFSVIDRK